MNESKKDARIAFLEKQAKWHLFTFDLLASLDDLHHQSSIERNPPKLFEVTITHLQKIISFSSSAFYLVNEKQHNFELTYLQSDEFRDLIESEVEKNIMNGKFAWIINQNRSVLLKCQGSNQTLLFHVLATKKRIRGMFVGVLEGMRVNLEEIIKVPITIILQNTANSLESIALYDLLKEKNENLENEVKRRTQSLEENLVKLKEEIAYRKLAEESLWLAKEAAESATRAKNDFLTNMSHEIRTPLNNILGYSEMLQYEISKMEKPELMEDLKVIESAGKHLLSLINDILDIAKIQANKIELSLEKFHVSRVLNGVIKEMLPLAQKNRNSLKLDLTEDPGELFSDLMRFRQVLLNIVGNACKFTSDGTISIHCHSEPLDDKPGIMIIISDTGIGIPSDQIKFLFNEFTQADYSKSRKYGGSGLGLAISKRLTKMLGGTIQVSSEEGKGTQFFLRFPLEIKAPDLDTFQESVVPAVWSGEIGAADDSEPAREIDEASGTDSDQEGSSEILSNHNGSPGSHSILLAQADRFNSSLLSRILQRNGWSVNQVSKGAQVLDVLQNHRTDLVILDVYLKEMSGFDLIDRIRDHKSHSGIPLIVFTGKSLTENDMERLRGKVHKVVTKGSCSRKDLLAIIREACEQKV